VANIEVISVPPIIGSVHPIILDVSLIKWSENKGIIIED